MEVLDWAISVLNLYVDIFNPSNGSCHLLLSKLFEA